jgi:hypothetical protein
MATTRLASKRIVQRTPRLDPRRAPAQHHLDAAMPTAALMPLATAIAVS